MDDLLIPPYGGVLKELLAPEATRAELAARAAALPRVPLAERALCDYKLLAAGGLSPLDRFMGEADYHEVLAETRLAGGSLFPMPVILNLPP